MRFIASTLLIALLAFALGLYLPWWSITVSSFLIAYLIPQKPLWSFTSSFLAILLLWGIMSWLFSSSNSHILAHRISELIIKQDSPGLLIIITALIGAIPAGFSGLSGSLLRSILIRR